MQPVSERGIRVEFLVSMLDPPLPGMQYGKQLVPVSAEEEQFLKYQAPRGIQVLGFLDSDAIPRQHFMKVRCPGMHAGPGFSW